MPDPRSATTSRVQPCLAQWSSSTCFCRSRSAFRSCDETRAQATVLRSTVREAWNCSGRSSARSYCRWVPTRSATRRPEASQRRSVEIDTPSTSAALSDPHQPAHDAKVGTHSDRLQANCISPPSLKRGCIDHLRRRSMSTPARAAPPLARRASRACRAGAGATTPHLSPELSPLTVPPVEPRHGAAVQRLPGCRVSTPHSDA